MVLPLPSRSDHRRIGGVALHDRHPGGDGGAAVLGEDRADVPPITDVPDLDRGVGFEAGGEAPGKVYRGNVLQSREPVCTCEAAESRLHITCGIAPDQTPTVMS